jgi:hypothetical protein
MTILSVVNTAWLFREMNVLLRDFWSALPVEITATAEAHPVKALITLGVLALVVARVAMAASGSSVALIAARVLLTAGGLLLLVELEVLALFNAVFTTITNDPRRTSAEL